MKNNVPDVQDIIGSATLSVIAKADKFNYWMYQEIKPYLKANVLEIGSGIGNISTFLLQEGYTTTLSDYNNNYVQHLLSNFSGFPNFAGALRLDLQHPTFEQEYGSLHQKFDTIFLLNVIEHLKDDKKAVGFCKFMLKPGGHLVLLAPAYNFLYCPFDEHLGHYRRYSTKSLSKLFQDNGLQITKKKYFNLAGIAGWFIWGKLLKKQQLEQREMHFFNMAVPLFKLADRLIFKKIGLSAIVAGKK
jgi:SAM-dependent methyltransferase